MVDNISPSNLAINTFCSLGEYWFNMQTMTMDAHETTVALLCNSTKEN